MTITYQKNMELHKTRTELTEASLIRTGLIKDLQLEDSIVVGVRDDLCTVIHRGDDKDHYQQVRAWMGYKYWKFSEESITSAGRAIQIFSPIKPSKQEMDDATTPLSSTRPVIDVAEAPGRVRLLGRVIGTYDVGVNTTIGMIIPNTLASYYHNFMPNGAGISMGFYETPLLLINHHEGSISTYNEDNVETVLNIITDIPPHLVRVE